MSFHVSLNPKLSYTPEPYSIVEAPVFGIESLSAPRTTRPAFGAMAATEKRKKPEKASKGAFPSQRLQYPLIKEYALNLFRNPTMI